MHLETISTHLGAEYARRKDGRYSLIPIATLKINDSVTLELSLADADTLINALNSCKAQLITRVEPLILDQRMTDFPDVLIAEVAIAELDPFIKPGEHLEANADESGLALARGLAEAGWDPYHLKERIDNRIAAERANGFEMSNAWKEVISWIERGDRVDVLKPQGDDGDVPDGWRRVEAGTDAGTLVRDLEDREIHPSRFRKTPESEDRALLADEAQG